MADQPISGLTALTGANTASGDLLEIVDVSDTTMAATGTNKKITRDEMKTALLASPGPIGGTTPAAGTFTSVNAGSGAITGGVGRFTTLSAEQTISNNAFYAGVTIKTIPSSGTYGAATIDALIASFTSTYADVAEYAGKAAWQTIGGDIALVSYTAGKEVQIYTGGRAAGNKRAVFTDTGLNSTVIGATTPAAGSFTTVSANGAITATTTIKTGGYTVATLPAAGTAGRLAYVTDALLPLYNAALTGGGAVVVPVFDNGVAWTSH